MPTGGRDALKTVNAIDQLHRETKDKGDRARDAMGRAANKLRLTIATLPAEQEEPAEGPTEKEKKQE